MKVELRNDWQDKLSGKAKIYPLGVQEKQVLEETFGKLIDQGRLERTSHTTPFSYPAYVVWRDMPDGQRKGRVVIDIRGLNTLVVPDTYPMASQNDILDLVLGNQFISRLDATSFFNQ